MLECVGGHEINQYKKTVTKICLCFVNSEKDYKKNKRYGSVVKSTKLSDINGFSDRDDAF